MNANIRTPAQVIGLVLEEAGVPDFGPVAEACARRLGVALRSVSNPEAQVICYRERDTLAWGTVAAKTLRKKASPRTHVHTRDCYDDPGPGHGSPGLICGKIEGEPE